MAAHTAVVAPAARTPLELHQNPTVKPDAGQIRVKVEWTASTPLDLHQADGGLLIPSWPHVLGDNVAGTVVEVASDVTSPAVGDKVMGFAWRNNTERAYQTYVTTDAFLFGKIPANVDIRDAATIPDNVVTALHSLTTELELNLPWPKPDNFKHPDSDRPFLIWGGSSSAGQYTIQVLKYYGFTNVFATASKRHHDYLKALGVAQLFDYSDAEVVSHINAVAGGNPIPYIFDCIGSLPGSVTPISKIATRGSKYAVLLPVIVKDASVQEKPEYAMDVKGDLQWAGGVEPIGVRTHSYLDNALYKEKLQSEIVPQLLGEGVIKPNRYRLIEGDTLLERAQKALDALRNKEASGERLVWKVADE